VKLVSFTVDPEHDTPAVLASYASRYQAEPGRWFFLTGDAAKLNALARDAFKLNSVDGTMTHSTRLVLVDRRGQIRGYYSTEENDPVPRLVADVKRLVRERS
jgi:protein SCO1/2